MEKTTNRKEHNNKLKKEIIEKRGVQNKNQSQAQTPFERYEALFKLSHRMKSRRKNKNNQMSDLIRELEKLCCKEELHLKNALKHFKKILK